MTAHRIGFALEKELWTTSAGRFALVLLICTLTAAPVAC